MLLHNSNINVAIAVILLRQKSMIYTLQVLRYNYGLSAKRDGAQAPEN